MALTLLSNKSYLFAVKMVRLKQHLQKNCKEYEISRQVMRSGTSVGASIKEAEFAQSDADFIYKLTVALKEANETIYWLSILKDTNYIKENAFVILSSECKEIIAILVSSIKKIKQKNNVKMKR
ncbi:MAG: four helix bundle protein [Candidatus Azobacteroides sp.]|nr:four helix bundle protein [Candidatus Azobacteroides sp.]